MSVFDDFDEFGELARIVGDLAALDPERTGQMCPIPNCNPAGGDEAHSPGCLVGRALEWRARHKSTVE